MRIRIALLLCLLFGLANISEAASFEPVKAKRVIQPTATSIVKSSYYSSDYVNEDYYILIEELNKAIQKQPDNHELYISLIDCYISTKNYDDAFKYLMFLLEQKDNGGLSADTIFEIKQLSNKTANKNKYTKFKSPVCVCLALMNLICDEQIDAEDHIRHAIANAKNKRILSEAIRIVFERSQNQEKAIPICNLYLSIYKDDKYKDDENGEMYANIINTKMAFLANGENIEEVIKEYEAEEDLYTFVDEETRYKNFLLMTEKGYSDKEILRLFYDSKNEKDIKGYYNICNILIARNDNVNAQLWQEKMEDKYPKEVMTALVKAKIYIKNGQQEKADEILTSIQNKLTTEDEINEYNFLTGTLSAQPIEEALKLMEQRLYSQAENILVRYQESAAVKALLGRCKIEQGNLEEALSYLNKAIAQEENNPAVNVQTGYYYIVTQDYETARKYINKALEINPNDQTTLRMLDRLNAAESNTYVNQIANALDAQNYEEAMRVINNALEIDPNSSNLYFYKGLVYIAQGNFAASTAALYKSIDLDSTNVLPYYYLGIAFDNLSEQENALTYYRKFLDLLPEDQYGESERVQYAQERIKKILTSK